MNGYTENKAARYRLPNTTTMEDLAMEVNATVGAVLKMGGVHCRGLRVR